MAAQSWLDGSMESAIEMLAKRAVVARRVRVAREKAAKGIDWGGLGDQLKGYGTKALDWVNTPGQEHLRYPLVGAGVGGLLGGLSSFGRPKEERQPFRSALTGGIAGAGAGLGGGLLRQNWDDLFPDPNTKPTKPPEIAELEKELAKRAPTWITPRDKGEGKGKGKGKGDGIAGYPPIPAWMEDLPYVGRAGLQSAALGAGSEALTRFGPNALSRGAGLEPDGNTPGTPADALRKGEVGPGAKLRATMEAHGLRSPVTPKPPNKLILPPPTLLDRARIPFSLKQLQAKLPSTALPGFSRGGIRGMGRAGAKFFGGGRGLLSRGRTVSGLAIPWIWELLRQNKLQEAAEEGAVEAYQRSRAGHGVGTGAASHGFP